MAGAAVCLYAAEGGLALSCPGLCVHPRKKGFLGYQ